jgi:hypothetical protein
LSLNQYLFDPIKRSINIESNSSNEIKQTNNNIKHINNHSIKKNKLELTQKIHITSVLGSKSSNPLTLEIAKHNGKKRKRREKNQTRRGIHDSKRVASTMTS